MPRDDTGNRHKWAGFRRPSTARAFARGADFHHTRRFCSRAGVVASRALRVLSCLIRAVACGGDGDRDAPEFVRIECGGGSGCGGLGLFVGRSAGRKGHASDGWHGRLIGGRQGGIFQRRYGGCLDGRRSGFDRGCLDGRYGRVVSDGRQCGCHGRCRFAERWVGRDGGRHGRRSGSGLFAGRGRLPERELLHGRERLCAGLQGRSELRKRSLRSVPRLRAVRGGRRVRCWTSVRDRSLQRGVRRERSGIVRRG